MLYCKNSVLVFPDRIEGKTAIIGVVSCLMYCIGIEILTCSVSKFFSLLSFVVYALAILLFGKIVINSLKETSIKKIVIWTMATFVFIFLISNILVGGIIQPIFFQIFDVTEFSSANTALIAERIHNNSMIGSIWMVTGCIFVGPLVEELLYRVCLFRVIFQKNKFAGHLVTAILFGLQHVFIAVVYGQHPQEFLLIGSYAAFSLILTNVYVKCKTPLPGILAHMILNTIGVFTML